MSDNDNYDVTFGLKITKNGEEYHSVPEVNYPNTNYGVVVAIEQLMIGVLNQLGYAGVKMAVEKGLADQLELMGIDVKR